MIGERHSRANRARRPGAALGLGPLAALVLLVSACADGDDGAPGPPAPAPDTATELEPDQDAPGVVLTILSLGGATGPGGVFESGDTISVAFRIEKADGSAWKLAEMDEGRILVSGPTFNYQRVIAEQTDLVARSVANGDGSYTYVFASPIPAVYLPPLNDSASFGELDGELTGQALLSGTYTVGMAAAWDYTVDGQPFRDAGDAWRDFLFDQTVALAPREVVGLDNCNQCHVGLRAHDDLWRAPVLCAACHTAGAEDANLPGVENGTTGLSVELGILTHRLHAGAHLPSVLGVATKPDGTRDYGATPAPYRVVSSAGAVHDYSGVRFPVMPSADAAFLFDQAGTTYQGAGGNGPMPRDVGFGALPSAHKELEDRIRTGIVSCASCHGDPDGAGPIEAPAQGDVIWSQSSRGACGSCHDDVDWTLPYISNGLVPMGPQLDDSSCLICHPPSGGSLAVQDAHAHPYSDPAWNTGVNVEITGVGGGSGPGGKHQLGDPIEVSFGVRDDAGVDLLVHALTRFQMVVTGPTTNAQSILPEVDPFDVAFRKSTPFTGNGAISVPTVGAGAVAQVLAIAFTGTNVFDVIGSVGGVLASGLTVPAAGSTGTLTHAGVSYEITDGSTDFAAGDRWYLEVVPLAPSYTLAVPLDIAFELVGQATGGAEILTVANLPLHWGRQVVYERSAISAATPTLAPSEALGRVAVVDATALGGIGVLIGDRVVIDPGLPTEEYLEVGRIQTTDDATGADLGPSDRLWFTAPLRYAHATSSAVHEATLTARREGVDYDVLDAGAGQLALVAGQFAAGNPVIVGYRSDGRFGWFRAPGDALQGLYSAAAADSDEIEQSWGDWKGLDLLDGTYRVGLWANVDFTLTPQGGAAPAVEAWDDFDSNNTTYRILSSPAVTPFLFGAATEIVEPETISSAENCDRCHGELQHHGTGRRGLATCQLCHSIPGAEDAPKYAFSAWAADPTPGVSADFRQLVHSLHTGVALADPSAHESVGAFLGTPYAFHVDEIGFPATPGGTKGCTVCHGASNEAWKEPAPREHPGQSTPTLEWRAVCTACHDADAALAHVDAETPGGIEACATCHGVGTAYAVEVVHKPR